MKYGVTEVYVKHDYFASLRVKLIKKENDRLYLLKDNGVTLEVVKEIKTSKKIYKAKDNFITSTYDHDLFYIYETGEHSIRRYKYIVHSGSSRSSKTYSLCDWTKRQALKENTRITVWRDTRESLGKTVWVDYRKLFALTGTPYKFPQDTKSISFKNGSTIEPHGADATNAHGLTQDIAWLNEPYKITKETFDQIDMRSSLIIIDMNPKESHWSDIIAKHPRCKVIHSTFKDNPFCPPEQRAKILSYDPSNPVNIANGTANLYNWQVYGLGMKAEKPNKIYHGWRKITDKQFDEIEGTKYYGIDWGESSPTAIVEIKYKDHHFYVRELLYKAGNQIESLPDELERLGVEKNIMIVCDSAEPLKVKELYDAGYYAVPAIKGPGSVESGISFLNKMKVSYTQSSDNLEYEYDEYEWDIDRYGLPTDKPIKKDDHLMDAFRYPSTMMQVQLSIIT